MYNEHAEEKQPWSDCDVHWVLQLRCGPCASHGRRSGVSRCAAWCSRARASNFAHPSWSRWKALSARRSVMSNRRGCSRCSCVSRWHALGEVAALRVRVGVSRVAVGGATHVRGTNWYEGENAFSMDGQPCGWNGEPYLADQIVAAASLVHGFLGLSYTPDDFHLDPHLPPGWNEMSAEIQVPRPPLPCQCAGQRPMGEGSHPSAIERIPMTTEKIPVTRIAPSPSEFICGVTFPNTSLSCGNSFRRVPEVLPLRAAN